MNQKILILVVIIFFPMFIQDVNAEPILITRSEFMEEIIFDGRWSNYSEWKPSSVDMIGIDIEVYLRSAHQGEFIYLMIDVVEDKTLDKNSDRSMVCFDTNNDKSKIADKNDYCFISTLGSYNGITLQGGTPLASKDHFKKIENANGFIAVGGVSGNNNRYSNIPHAVYEFKIPLELIGRSDNYGFLTYVYDANKNEVMTYPKSILEDSRSIPSPSQWGDIISPDKSLPEFDEAIILFSITLLPIFILSKFKKNIFNMSLNK